LYTSKNDYIHHFLRVHYSVGSSKERTTNPKVKIKCFLRDQRLAGMDYFWFDVNSYFLLDPL
jgi:hypothetical protein